MLNLFNTTQKRCDTSFRTSVITQLILTQLKSNRIMSGIFSLMFKLNVTQVWILEPALCSFLDVMPVAVNSSLPMCSTFHKQITDQGFVQIYDAAKPQHFSSMMRWSVKCFPFLNLTKLQHRAQSIHTSSLLRTVAIHSTCWNIWQFFFAVIYRTVFE